jgi:hypothetical protein
VHGARGAQPRHPLGGARTGAAPAMRSLPAVGLAPLEPATGRPCPRALDPGVAPVGRLSRGLTRRAAQFSPDRRRAARAAAAGARAPRVKTSCPFPALRG